MPFEDVGMSRVPTHVTPVEAAGGRNKRRAASPDVLEEPPALWSPSFKWWAGGLNRALHFIHPNHLV